MTIPSIEIIIDGLLKYEYVRYNNEFNTFQTVDRILICGFPGVGKTTCFKEDNFKNVKFIDSDSSKFPKDEFPHNYIKHISSFILYEEDDLAFPTTINFISTHDVVLQELIRLKVRFNLVYPSKHIKSEYIQRYYDRKSPQSFIDLLEKNYDTWIDALASLDVDEKYCNKIILNKRTYMSDALRLLLKDSQ
jgi:hypothetical protein